MSERLFEIPVYRISPDAWFAEVEAFESKTRMAYLRQVPTDSKPESSSIERHVSLAMRAQGYDRGFDYEQVMGWVCVELDGSGVIKAYGYHIPQ